MLQIRCLFRPKKGRQPCAWNGLAVSGINKYGSVILAMEIKNIIFDMDGVLHRGKTPIPDAADALGELRKRGFGIFFLTNNGEHPREFFVERLRGFGFEAYVDEMYSSSYGTARYISEKFPGKSAFAFSRGMQEELEKNGIKIDNSNKAEVVVASLDVHLSYDKLVAAFQAIIGGGVFLASNEDASYPVENGVLKPGAGAITAALEKSTGRKPIIIGKPQPYLLDIIVKEHGLEKGKTLMVGDRLETDILMAKQEGLKSCFVLSGVSRKEEVEETGLEPDFVLDSVAGLPGILD
ncbi:HAD-IIA family hydrolase [Candidatus Micrarchaeota archaeon]|nr:HAD-IIA family hydrolase [Candidatus Micrarchaeota archaeon]MBD3417490.1 HAD-IIA family hydrolase [Candidatus Micrarchaeota archaeon]